jgi:hypothetical protein
LFRWLKNLLSRQPFRVAAPWETPPEIRKKLRCAIAGIDPDTVQEPENGKAAPPVERPALETRPPAPH